MNNLYYEIIINGYQKYVKSKNLDELIEILDNINISHKFVNDNQDKYKNVLENEIKLYNHQKNLLEKEIKLRNSKSKSKSKSKPKYNSNSNSNSNSQVTLNHNYTYYYGYGSNNYKTPPKIIRQRAELN